MQTVADVAQKQIRSYRRNSYRNISSIELPDTIDNLIDNKLFRNKFKALIRRGHLRELLELAEIAKTKAKPSRWFAKATSKANWDATLKFLAKARQVARAAAEIAKRLKIPANAKRVLYAACWRLGTGAVRHAVTAADVGKDKWKMFCWLVWKGEAWKKAQLSTSA